MNDVRLAVVIQRQKRLMFYNLLISLFIGGALIASVFALS